jgi:heptosyltransferase-2
MAKVINAITLNFDVNLLFNYMPNQKRDAEKLFNLCNAASQKKIFINVIGNSIRDFIALMNQCDLIIGNDGGATNMAKALQKPSFILFCPWIDKQGWSLLEDGTNHVSFHLDEFLPELFENIRSKDVKKNYEEYYKKFVPELFLNQLETFLNHHVNNKDLS